MFRGHVATDAASMCEIHSLGQGRGESVNSLASQLKRSIENHSHAGRSFSVLCRLESVEVCL